jgi:hypothetical protein
MSIREPRYSKEEFARRGNEIYERDIRPVVEEGNKGKIVAIDIETGMYELGASVRESSERLYARRPDAQVWAVRVGYKALCSILSPTFLRRRS